MPSPPDHNGPRLLVRGLGKAYGARPVLAGVDLEVAPASIVLLAGSNGSGKTTLLRCLAGLASHDGEVRIDGRPRDGGPEDRREVGYLPQRVGLPDWARVDEVLDLFRRLRDAEGPDLPPGFLPPGEQPIGELSGGQRQRVAIAVSLLGEPRLLLLDEPAANLDDHGRGALFDVLSQVRDRGTSILVAAPSPADLGGLPDRTVRLTDGRLSPRRPVTVVPSPSAAASSRHLEEVVR